MPRTVAALGFLIAALAALRLKLVELDCDRALLGLSGCTETKEHGSRSKA